MITELELRLEIARLSEENQRLRDAGNSLFYNLLMVKDSVPDNGNTRIMIHQAILEWNPKYGTSR